MKKKLTYDNIAPSCGTDKYYIVKESKMSKFLKDFERSTNLLVEMFCKKQECEVDHIVADDITGVYAIGDNFFSLSDIYYDMKENKPKGLIFEWQNYLSDINMSIGDNVEKCFINYDSYCMGARFENIK